MPNLVRQPEGSSLCGQCCVAMAAEVSLDRAIEAVGHAKYRGTYTRELVAALRSLGVQCADRLRRVSRKKPVLPRRAVICIVRYGIPGVKRPLGHWMLTWDGQILDPGGVWPQAYPDWVITSYLEIDC